MQKCEENFKENLENKKMKLKLRSLENTQKYFSYQRESKKKMNEKLSNYIAKLQDKKEKAES